MINTTKIKFVSLLLITLIAINERVHAQQALIDAINHYSMSISHIVPDTNFADLQKLKPILNDKQLIALGESTHGTKEFFQFKDRLMRFLIKETGVKTFVIEADFSGAILMNDYVVNGIGDRHKALLEMGITFWMNKEFIEMIEWIKRYNSTQNNEDKVRFYGCDMQTPAKIIKLLLNGSIKTQKPLSAECIDGLHFLFNLQVIDESSKELMNKTAEELKNVKVSGTDTGNILLYQHAITTIIQAIDLKLNRNNEGMRDMYLSENCQWIFNFQHENKMAIWAHNLHICKYSSTFKYPSMGNYLEDKYKASYYALGFGFYSGTVRAYPMEGGSVSRVFNVSEVTLKNSSDYIFSLSNKPNFILDFSSTFNNFEIQSFIHKDIFSRTIGSSFDPRRRNNGTEVKTPLLSLYDGIVFIKKTTAASPEFSDMSQE